MHRINNKTTSAITVTTELENHSIKYSEVQKTWGMISLQAHEITSNSSLLVDFVFLIDISASMRVDSKLTFVQATIGYLLEKLNEKQTISLVTFNHEVRSIVTLLPCTSDNKRTIIDLVKKLEASGSTNISEALFTGTTILARRDNIHRSIGSLMLFTDGLSNQGPSTEATLQSLKDIQLPPGCIFNTFGLGVDHDSSLLQSIALRAQGVYYYVETTKDIPTTFGECVAGILSTTAHRIKLKLRCNDGARLVTIATPFKITEQRVAKDYDIDLELMYGGETKCILFRVSLR
jgi:Mg-chelatase subunit ChlD